MKCLMAKSGANTIGSWSVVIRTVTLPMRSGDKMSLMGDGSAMTFWQKRSGNCDLLLSVVNHDLDTAAAAYPDSNVGDLVALRPRYTSRPGWRAIERTSPA